MAGKTKRNELTETFVDAWRREECLWDVTSHHYKNREKKQKSINYHGKNRHDRLVEI